MVQTMISLTLLILGIVLVIVNANDLLIVNNWLIYLVFGLSATLFAVQIIYNVVTARKAKEYFNMVKSNFDRSRFR